jgi:zinc/manganese transport system substrate-binding protein
VSARTATAGLLAGAALALGACGSATPATGPGGIRVVATENFWGSIAGQLAGPRGTVKSLITNPGVDPHSYEPTAADARALATAQLVIVNGLDYDPWARRLLAANPVPDRIVIDVGHVLGLKDSDNPHRWYDPANVTAVAGAITTDLERLDPRHRRDLANRGREFQTVGLAAYHHLIASIRARYAGTPVGASESIFALLAPALGLRLITPASFMNATSEGTDVSAQDEQRTEQQIASRRIRLWVFNSQNATPAIQNLNALAHQRHIPAVSVTETLSPATVSFQRWQVEQLTRIDRALGASR